MRYPVMLTPRPCGLMMGCVQLMFQFPPLRVKWIMPMMALVIPGPKKNHPRPSIVLDTPSITRYSVSLVFILCLVTTHQNLSLSMQAISLAHQGSNVCGSLPGRFSQNATIPALSPPIITPAHGPSSVKCASSEFILTLSHAYVNAGRSFRLASFSFVRTSRFCQHHFYYPTPVEHPVAELLMHRTHAVIFS